jgi:hypothetical protein
MITRSALAAWAVSHKSLVATLTSGTVIAALVAVAAVASTGYSAKQVDLDDATVWVTSDLHQAVARANPQVGELNTAVRMESGSLAVSQHGQTVVVSDLGGGEARILDTAAAQVAETVSLPVGDVRIALGASVAVVTSRTTGDVWITDPGSLASFDPDAPADLTLGTGGDSVIASDGTVFAVSAATGSVFTVRPGVSGGATPSTSIVVDASDDVSITALGNRWAVLDRTAGRLITESGSYPVPLPTGVDESWLQSASADAPGVLVATTEALLDVSLADGTTTPLSQGHTGTSVSPVQVGGCWYAGWSDGRSWSRCSGGQPREGTLEGAVAGDTLAFRTDGLGGVLLSDAVTGRAWDVTRENTPIDNWDDLLPDTAADEQSNDTVTDEPVAVDPAQRPPVAVDDELGARPGRSTVLPVLLNDYDPNGDVIVVDEVRVPDGAEWSVQRITDDQQLQLTLPETASGELSFGYTISDGRGGTADATVRVAVRAPGENSPPVQSTRSSLDVAVGGRADADIRSDWYDPDGDAFFVQSAAVAAPDVATYTPAGVVTYTDAGQSTGAKEVSLSVSDGQAATVGTIGVTVHPEAEIALRAEGFPVLAQVGQPITVSPLGHVSGASASLRLANVPAHEGFEIVPDYAGGTVRITAQAAGSQNIDYAVSDGAKTASGVIRVIATLPPDANTRPVTVPHAAFARQNTSVLVDVLATDFDPAGGVLIVTGVDGVSAADGLRVEIVDQRMIRVTLTRPLATGSSSFGYTVTNGLADARGSVSVVEIPEPVQRQPPIAVADTASVRVGDVVDIPVLANDVHPDGDPLTLAPDLVQPLGADSGLLFTSGSRLRYLAPDVPGDFTAVYRVEAPDGQWATAPVTISVREADATANAAPVPQQVTARVIAGETVRIPIPLNGIDPDGDSVQFLGIDSVPDKGSVSETGTDWIDYTAGDYSTGTDDFRYSVVDRLGARASGTIRVGVSARPEGARNPVATPDEVLVRPGKTVSVRVLQNDSDPDGGALTVTGVEAVTPDASATIVDDMLSIVAPREPGRYGFIYSIANSRGGTASSFATIDVSADAPLARPQVSDTVLSLTDILDKSTVEVDVLDNVFFAEGPASQLWLSVMPAYTSVARVDSGRVRVSVKAERQVIPFTVAHPDDPNVRSSGFIWVPGTDDALPQLRPDAPKLTVQSGSALKIPLNDYVVAVGGRSVHVTDPNSVRATHADGSPLVADARTLVFRSAEKYFGPASVSFEVSDGAGANARTATLVLPITVTPRDDQPPVFSGATVEFEPGQQKVLDLGRLTTSPSGAPSTGFRYQLLDPKPAGFSAVLSGSTLTLAADVGAKKGTQGALTIGVDDGVNAGVTGRIELSVVPSTKPLAVPATDTVIAPRGQTTTVDVLANDGATNPFPQQPLTVVAVRGADAGSLPPGITVVPSADNRVLQVTVAADAPASDITLQYQVLDGTGDPERATWGTVRIAVQDRPGPITGLTVIGFGDRSVRVSFAAGPANNSPITGFDVVTRTESGSAIVSQCASTTCDVGTPGNGPGNAVTVSVAAKNAIGSSDAASYATPVWSDLLPTAPGAVTVSPRDGALDVRWSTATVGSGGSPVKQYDVSADGRLVETVDATGPGCDGAGCRTTISGLVNGQSTTISVTARNSAYPALAVWPSASASGTPYGPPTASSVSAVANLDSGPGSVTVSWPEFTGNGDRVTGYYAQLLGDGVSSTPTGAQSCSVSSPAPGTVDPPRAGGEVAAQQSLGGDARSATFDGLTQVDSTYAFVVWGYNAAGCVASAVVSAVAYPSPGKVDASGVAMSMVSRQDDKVIDAQIDSVATPRPVSNPRYYVRALDADGNAGAPVALQVPNVPRELTDGDFGSAYRFVIRACNVFSGVEVCGPYSDPVTAPEPSITFTFAPGEPSYDGIQWRWTSPPQNGSLQPEFGCGDRSVSPDDPPAGQVIGPNSCTPGSPVAIGDAGLYVLIGGHSYVYLG